MEPIHFNFLQEILEVVRQGIELIVEALNELIDSNNNVTILLEGMSGKGTEIGRTMEELKAIIDGIKYCY